MKSLILILLTTAILSAWLPTTLFADSWRHPGDPNLPDTWQRPADNNVFLADHAEWIAAKMSTVRAVPVDWPVHVISNEGLATPYQVPMLNDLAYVPDCVAPGTLFADWPVHVAASKIINVGHTGVLRDACGWNTLAGPGSL